MSSEARRAQAPRSIAIACWLLALSARGLGLLHYPLSSADEGIWLTDVWRWIATGQPNYSYAEAPGYFWQMAPAAAWFPRSLLAARLTAFAFGAGSFVLLFCLARRFMSTTWAHASVAFLGTGYAAGTVGRQGFVEPFQLFWMLAAVLAAGVPGAAGCSLVALAVAMMLLTKLSAGFMLPLLLLGALTEVPRRSVRQLGWLVAGLAIGVGLAVAGFAYVRALDPENFRMAWSITLNDRLPDAAPIISFGRFGIDPRLIDGLFRSLGADEPLQITLAVIGTMLLLVARRAMTVALWFVGAIGFLAIQTWRLEQHMAIIYPPMALLAALAVSRLPDANAGWRALTRSVMAAVIIAFGALRLAAAGVTTRDAGAPLLADLGRRAKPTDQALMAPYLALRSPIEAHVYQELDPEITVDRRRLAAMGVRWVLLDNREWGAWAARRGVDVRASLAACCRQVAGDATASLWVVAP